MDRRPRLLDQLVDVVEVRFVKITLAVLIIISLLPLPLVHDGLRPLFLFAFGLELLLRVIGLLRRREGARRRRFERLFVLVDVLAFVSFFPLERWLDARWLLGLTMLRLARLLVLVRFARDLAADLYSIMTRREQLQQFGLVTAAVWGLAFVGAVVLEQLGVLHDYDGEGRPSATSFLDRLWWSFRQLESADNLVASLHGHPLLSVVSLCLTIVGVFVVSFIIGIGANIVEQVVRAERRRAVRYVEHSLVIGPVHEAEMLVREFVRLYERNRVLRRLRASEVWQWLFRHGPMPRRHALPRMALLGTADDPPNYLYEASMRWVVYRQGDGWDPESLERVGAAEAKRAIVLSRADAGADADAVTGMALASFRAQNPDAQVFVEVRESDNRAIMTAIGGPHTFALDMPRFLGLFLCQHLVTPGVEELYTDLMTADGSEFYTHIFLDAQEIAAVHSLGEDGYVSFERMARVAYRERGVILAGVFLGERTPRPTRGLVPVDGLVQWLNPLREPPEGSPAKGLGARAGMVPLATLRGLIGVTATYAPLRRYGRDVVMGHGVLPPGGGKAVPAGIAQWAGGMQMARGLLARVLVVGYSEALPSMLRELSRFMPGVDAVLVLGERGDERMPLGERLASLGIGLEGGLLPPGKEGITVPLEHGGKVTVYTHKGPDLASFAVQCAAKGGAVGAAVFLSEPDAVDRDARTAMRLLRFVRALEHGEVPRGERLHLLAEFASVAKGEHVRRLVDAKRCGYGADRLRLSLVSTERIKNYFMVHSAFVPGVTALYDEILAEEGQEIVRLEPPTEMRVEGLRVGFGQILEALEPRQCIALAVETADGRVMLNPARGEAFALGEIRAIYALAESRDLEEEAVRNARERAGAPRRAVGVAGVAG
ncbi:hypothetical protein [Polyangium aurulentum]|uniref:hypothetical protein n=1 Tax=Polyangium aurulentum TaxID=2567896 RepID=UPI0010AE9A15|nr:hypothetical protein [Polyangium aurulentum]UQA57892.1 hypothetical protein E8A73_042565 [Polyangium aurulentum]